MGFLSFLSAALVALVVTGNADMSIFVALLPLLLDYVVRIYQAYRQLEQLKELQKQMKDLRDDKDNT